MGCTYIQVDAPDFGQLVDPSQQELWAKAGIPFDRVLTEGVDMLNELATVPGVTFAVHLCKGNYDSQWISAGGYESLAERMFPRLTNYERVLLEYENDRSGSFEPLKRLPDDKIIVLGLVSSKFDDLETPEQLLARIDEAANFYPRDQLALSTQCGFSSAGEGNAVSEGAQERKLQLVAQVARQAWG
jgi:5-methyltetrahydropteroyltriglutamate--homocysteine methyltransferase